jgi:hypothetical protein
LTKKKYILGKRVFLIWALFFFFFYLENGASNQQCSEIFAGPQPLSEVENRNLRDFANANRNRIKLYLTFHTFGEVSICVSAVQGGAKFKCVYVCASVTQDGEKLRMCASLIQDGEKLRMSASLIQNGAKVKYVCGPQLYIYIFK